MKQIIKHIGLLLVITDMIFFYACKKDGDDSPVAKPKFTTTGSRTFTAITTNPPRI